ncbi:hypothetical protein KIH27_15910 [Mycobacterium sp. M1]|uniref:Uncharacterized protein n=1 Tax=Mycolicibacter acidiphilus TaxID=2835306 RepID=A0ABS5RNF5_9MYCO|nr:hypothetical protein [Mycolicibacter acidiphilus]MBS9535073.1 hypothetical protein [Mycolicibacter acidiphilus]
MITKSKPRGLVVTAIGAAVVAVGLGVSAQIVSAHNPEPPTLAERVAAESHTSELVSIMPKNADEAVQQALDDGLHETSLTDMWVYADHLAADAYAAFGYGDADAPTTNAELDDLPNQVRARFPDLSREDVERFTVVYQRVSDLTGDVGFMSNGDARVWVTEYGYRNAEAGLIWRIDGLDRAAYERAEHEELALRMGTGLAALTAIGAAATAVRCRNEGKRAHA